MESSQIHAYEFKVIGRVQGVSFRYSTMSTAQKLNIYGTITNDDDGSVSGIIQGNTEQLDAMINYLHQGPRFALVRSVQIHEISPINVTSFEIVV